MASLPQFILDLSTAEKLQLVYDLWDHIAETPERIPVPESLKEDCSVGKRNSKHNPECGLSWDEVEKRVRSHFGR